MTKVTVLLADDHPIVRRGLRDALAKEPNLVVVGEAKDGSSALELVRTLKADVVVADISMPGMDGMELAKQIRDKGLATQIIFLTIHRDREFVDEALRTGARGYVLKDSATEEIVAAIREVAKGGYYASPGVTAHLIERHRRADRLSEIAPGVSELTATERRILALIAECKTSSEIGELLHISPRTVDTHRTNISNKLELRGKHALMKFAVGHRSELG